MEEEKDTVISRRTFSGSTVTTGSGSLSSRTRRYGKDDEKSESDSLRLINLQDVEAPTMKFEPRKKGKGSQAARSSQERMCDDLVLLRVVKTDTPHLAAQRVLSAACLKRGMVTVLCSNVHKSSCYVDHTLSYHKN